MKDISTRAFAGLSALALAAGIAVGAPTVAHAGDPRPCAASYTVTKTGAGQPLAGAKFTITAPAGSLIVPADQYLEAFFDWSEMPGSLAFGERTAPVWTAIPAVRQIPTAPQQNWGNWYTATDAATEAMYISAWVDDTATQGIYRDVLTQRIAKADAIPGGVGAQVVADAEAALAALDTTLSTSDYAAWVTAHKAVYAIVSAAPTVDYAPEMTDAEKAMDADHRAGVVARYGATAERVSGANGEFSFAVWNPSVLLGPECTAASISPVLTEVTAPDGFIKLNAPVTLTPRSTDDDGAYENSATIDNEPVKPESTPTPEPTPGDSPTPTATPEPTPAKPSLPETGV